ncbi:tyrosine-type recombinase/integrase [Streptomyces hesseae]|uniref:Tyrosine-type recombinase/integrase n=1 Tax=Streptomyces hesseae TaxID=3075519 RepID=A0ABU2SN62_9ACTN|nr:tyrosine-type recombinase/integrase [Streptomyces sp. DSM 40473]MDT0449220.1 tyrosine-type recombinase/integrase [Streptomyces sp. DSM 40473]
MLSREAGVSRTTLHDLRHLAAMISITAGVPLTVVSEALRHSTLSTTANVYSHLTTQAAREAVDVIDKILTQADRPPTPPRPIPAPRPPCDHIPQLHNQMTIISQPTSTRNYCRAAPPAARGCDHLATTSRHKIRKAALASCENGLRPAEIAGRDGGI